VAAEPAGRWVAQSLLGRAAVCIARSIKLTLKIYRRKIKKFLLPEGIRTKDTEGIQQSRLPENRRHCVANWST